nr:hypothetical protein Iba_chr07bCG8300 [Ipomoea batatas]
MKGLRQELSKRLRPDRLSNCRSVFQSSQSSCNDDTELDFDEEEEKARPTNLQSSPIDDSTTNCPAIVSSTNSLEEMATRREALCVMFKKPSIAYHGSTTSSAKDKGKQPMTEDPLANLTARGLGVTIGTSSTTVIYEAEKKRVRLVARGIVGSSVRRGGLPTLHPLR